MAIVKAAAPQQNVASPTQTNPQTAITQPRPGALPAARGIGGIGKAAPAAKPTPAYVGNMGQAGVDKAEALLRRRAKRRQAPFNYRLKPGESSDLIILDYTLDPDPAINWDGVHFDNEHEIWVPDPETNKEKPVYEGCPKDIPGAGQCPLCIKMSKKPSYYNMKLTALEIRYNADGSIQTWTNKKGEVFQYGRRIVRVKSGQIPKFNLIREINGNGTFRGIQLRMTRDMSGKDAAIGEPVFVAQHSEQDIIDFAGHGDRISDAGVVYAKANEDCYPVNYKLLYPTPVVEELVAEYGAFALPGSRAADQQALRSIGGGTQHIPSENLGAPSGADDIPFDA